MSTKLRVAVLGRTEMLLDAARVIADEAHIIGFVATCKAAGHELVDDKAFEKFAQSVGAPFFRGPKLDVPAATQLIQEAACDIAISMNWPTLIPQRVRALFAQGIFNAHGGDLPKFKGNACPNWALLCDERRLALTIHSMIDELDAGPIALKMFLDLDENTEIGDVYAWLRKAVPEAFRELVTRASDGKMALTPQPSDPSSGLRCYPRRPEDGRINWASSPKDNHRLIRASGRPFSGAFTTLEGQRRLVIWRSSIVSVTEPFLAMPGQVAFSIEGDPVVVSGDGYLRLLDITLEGCDNRVAAKAAILSSLRQRLM
jgi:methionyl-tRNA formyltransferase